MVKIPYKVRQDLNDVYRDVEERLLKWLESEWQMFGTDICEVLDPTPENLVGIAEMLWDRLRAKACDDGDADLDDAARGVFWALSYDGKMGILTANSARIFGIVGEGEGGGHE